MSFKSSSTSRTVKLLVSINRLCRISAIQNLIPAVPKCQLPRQHAEHPPPRPHLDMGYSATHNRPRLLLVSCSFSSSASSSSGLVLLLVLEFRASLIFLPSPFPLFPPVKIRA